MTKPHTLTGSLARLAVAVADEAGTPGEVSALAEVCGVDESTIWRWGHGTVPGPHTIKVVNDLCRARGIKPVWKE